MVLVEVVQLVVHVDWSSDVLLECDFDRTVSVVDYTALAVLLLDALNALAHDVENDAE